MIDRDGSGKIDKEEILSLLKGNSGCDFVNREALKKEMEIIDNNGDGEIDFEEF